MTKNGAGRSLAPGRIAALSACFRGFTQVNRTKIGQNMIQLPVEIVAKFNSDASCGGEAPARPSPRLTDDSHAAACGATGVPDRPPCTMRISSPRRRLWHV